MEINLLSILTKARDLIDAPEKWTVKALARDKYDGIVGVHSKLAVCYCARGAILKAISLQSGLSVSMESEEDIELNRITPILADILVEEKSLTRTSFYTRLSWNNVTTLIDFNNNAKTEHSDIMNLFNRAIEKVKAS